MSNDFSKEWGNICQNCERDYEFEYQPLQPYNSLSDALKVVTNLLGMHPCEGTEVVPEDATSHTCLLAGKYHGMVTVLVKAKIEFDNIEFTTESTDTKSVRLTLTCRCQKYISVGIYIHRMVVNWQTYFMLWLG
ncbi:hypothetical protein POM88_015435 [Heracleum sosnowskyi]|uniref:Coatomer subunit gamma C-terminal domain-containing protein n=1 Tax=Heracleum sosnowskyi TaxID=360622 RepID=A0AAD8MWD8_9APIA|nr:hypothetical protein POM88_015435 [Heracleum sosnowskyi]